MMILGHGGMGSPDSIEKATQMSLLAEAENFYVAYPEGVSAPTKPGHGTWNAGGGACGYAAKKNVDDVGFVVEMTMDVTKNFAVHPEAIWPVGFSNAAMLVYRLAAEAAEMFCAAVCVAGTLCIPDAIGAAKVPFLHIHGEKDSNVPFGGGLGDGEAGVAYRSVPDSIKLLLAPRGRAISWERRFKGYTRTRYNCQKGAPVELVVVTGGEHGWFGGTQPGFTDSPIDASHEAVAFARPFLP
jgi:polyhydroxybutyrate depolymerase